MITAPIDPIQLGKDIGLGLVAFFIAAERAMNVYTRMKNKNGERRHDNPGHGTCKAVEAVEPVREGIERFEHAVEKLGDRLATSMETRGQVMSDRHTEVMTKLAEIQTAIQK